MIPGRFEEYLLGYICYTFYTVTESILIIVIIVTPGSGRIKIMVIMVVMATMMTYLLYNFQTMLTVLPRAKTALRRDWWGYSGGPNRVRPEMLFSASHSRRSLLVAGAGRTVRARGLQSIGFP